MPGKPLIRVVAVGIGLWAAWLWVVASGRGFPDGGLTELDRAFVLPRRVLMVALAGCSVWLLLRPARPRWALAVAALLTVTELLLPSLGAALGLRDGGGG